jgi:hypothetical protein
VRSLDDLEQPRLVEPGVGDDQLVELRSGKHCLDLRPRVDLAGEVVDDAAAARAERLAQVPARRLVADEHRAPAHTDGTKHRSRDHFVARAEEADQRGDDHRTDDVEAKRREVLPRADRKRERER